MGHSNVHQSIIHMAAEGESRKEVTGGTGLGVESWKQR